MTAAMHRAPPPHSAAACTLVGIYGIFWSANQQQAAILTCNRCRVVVSGCVRRPAGVEKSVLVRNRPTLTLSRGEPIGFGKDCTPSKGCLKGSETLWKAPFQCTSAPAQAAWIKFILLELQSDQQQSRSSLHAACCKVPGSIEIVLHGDGAGLAARHMNLSTCPCVCRVHACQICCLPGEMYIPAGSSKQLLGATSPACLHRKVGGSKHCSPAQPVPPHKKSRRSGSPDPEENHPLYPYALGPPLHLKLLGQ